MSNSRLSQLLQTSHQNVLSEWVEAQLKADTMRRDLITENDLREQSTEFLRRFERAVATGEVTNIKAAVWEPTLEILDELSRNRGRMGFTPSETATFVLSLKEPLALGLRKGGGNPEELFDETWATSTLLDRLALHTMEVFQQTREEIIARQQEDMLELSTPVVKIWDGIVALPLIGTLDSARTGVVMESLLQRIVETGSDIAIIDITGVPTVDTLVAQHLLKTVAAARLMGADCIISGIRPQIAQTMVHLQIDLSSVTTKATMAEALRTGLARTGHRVVRDHEGK